MSTTHLRSSGPTLVTAGRINLDLYNERLGGRMRDATRFVASVGGSPTNIAIVAQRLGTSAAVITAVGDDPAGELVRRQLENFGVATDWVGTIPGHATSMAMLSTVSPDDGERQFYRHDPADIYVTADVLDSIPWDAVRLVMLSADALARGPMAQVLRSMAERGREYGIPVWWDLDWREVSWADDGAYATAVGSAVAGADLVTGTEDEIGRMLGGDASTAATRLLERGDVEHVLLKTGPNGATLYSAGSGETIDMPAVATHLVSTVGAGDTLAGSLAHARLRGDDWHDALAFAMRAAAWTVQQPGCSAGFPTARQVLTMPHPEG